MKLFLLIFLLPFTNSPIGYRQLRWEDFKGKPPANTEASACTCTNISIGMDTAYAIFLSDRSWTKTNDPELLRHEQLHFKITEKMAKDIAVWIKVSNALSQHEEAISVLLYKWRLMEELYDLETDHGRDSTAQKRWEQEIKL